MTDRWLPAAEQDIKSGSHDELVEIARELAGLSTLVTIRLTERQEDEMVDVDEAARLTGLSRQTLYRSPVLRRPGRPVRFSRRRIEEWQRERSA